jgi:hypothetical protein
LVIDDQYAGESADEDEWQLVSFKTADEMKENECITKQTKPISVPASISVPSTQKIFGIPADRDVANDIQRDIIHPLQTDIKNFESSFLRGLTEGDKAFLGRRNVLKKEAIKTAER